MGKRRWEFAKESALREKLERSVADFSWGEVAFMQAQSAAMCGAIWEMLGPSAAEGRAAWWLTLAGALMFSEVCAGWMCLWLKCNEALEVAQGMPKEAWRRLLPEEELRQRGVERRVWKGLKKQWFWAQEVSAREAKALGNALAPGAGAKKAPSQRV